MAMMMRSLLFARTIRHARSATALQNAARALSTQARLNVAVVGTGRMGQIRLEGLAVDPRVNIAAIVDSIAPADVCHALENQYKTRCYKSVEEAGNALLQQGAALDGVWVATPTPSHLAIIQECTNPKSSAIKQLRAIGIEKPVGGTLEEIDEAYDACFRQHVHLFCSFQRRFDPSYRALWTECVEQQRLGQIQSIHTVFRDHPCPPIEFLKTGGDPFHDLAVHDIDFVCHLLNEYPTRVYAYGTSLAQELCDVNVMDKASVWLEFGRSGVICTMDLSRSAVYGYDQRIEVAGEQGMLQVLNPSKTTLLHSSTSGIEATPLVHSLPQRFREAYLHERDSFIDVLQGKQQPPVTWNAARMATIVSEAARLSAVNRKMVTIKYDKTHQRSERHDPVVQCEYEF
ncbi:TPA: hypothetical protein N0F65_001683 [Lagenidium giganteum]|uniref:Uncharacterized protein n=1 Tax=Lagenidium giganteum TaxID=4803 RepID=A0AAV2Z0B4_9STRA|nr:TPA: hypothetical protein N0F65_001683 [Lagenidium giganteum]